MNGLFLILFWATVFAMFFIYLAVAGWIVEQKMKKRHKKRTAKVHTFDSSMDINISA